MESMAAFSCELLCYIADIPFSASYPLENRGQKRQRSLLKLARLSDPPHVGYAHAPDITRARQRSLPAMARARSIARWLFSRHISGTQSFQENCHIHINVLVAQKPFVPPHWPPRSL